LHEESTRWRRRLNLALRLIRHEARTVTVRQRTGCRRIACESSGLV
jgi:hypothetical protein